MLPSRITALFTTTLILGFAPACFQDRNAGALFGIIGIYSLLKISAV